MVREARMRRGLRVEWYLIDEFRTPISVQILSHRLVSEKVLSMHTSKGSLIVGARYTAKGNTPHGAPRLRAVAAAGALLHIPAGVEVGE